MPAALDLKLGRLYPKQVQLLEAIQDTRPDSPTVIGFGGSRGAAKSGAVQRIALILTKQAGTIVWIIRRVWDDLNKDHVQTLFAQWPELQPYWHAGEKKLALPNGSTIYFIHAGDTGRAKRKSRGPQAHYIFLEQAEEFKQEEMEQLAGSNRAPGTAPGTCKRIYTFNPGGIGTAYLRRIFHLKQYHDNERPGNFLFIQGFGWDNYEWFRGAVDVDVDTFYWDWSEERRFQTFINETDFGRNLNGLPPSQRIGELMGSFDTFAGQYYADVWEPGAIVLPQDLMGRIIQPWWRRWLATDWGFSHYAATYWLASGLLSPEQVTGHFGTACGAPVRVIMAYRELVCNDVPEPDLARLILTVTPESERREIRYHWLSPDAWQKRGGANTVAEQMGPILERGGLQTLSQANTDRVGGWRAVYNAFGSARKLRRWAGPTAFVQSADELPALFVSANCPELIAAVPMLICDENDPTDVRKIPGAVEDDVADALRYAIKSYIEAAGRVPDSVTAAETWQRYQDPTARAMAMLQLSAKQKQGQYLHRRVRA